MALRLRSVLVFVRTSFGSVLGIQLLAAVALGQAPTPSPAPSEPPTGAPPEDAGSPPPPPSGPSAELTPTPPAPAPVAPASPVEGSPPAAAPPLASAADAGVPEEPAGVAEATPAEPPTANLEQITVTARHRVEDLQEVPIAVTAVTERDLKASGAFTLRQVQNQVPSLQILGFNPRNITIQIRGIGTTAGTVNSGIEPGVGVYVNGVYFARPSVAVFDLFDIEGINVLRGPQGTLFGKNTVGGVIDIQTNTASYTPEFRAELSYGNFNYSQLKLAASAPIGKTGFAVRVAGVKSDRDGTVYNTVFKDGWQDYHNQGIRGEIAYRSPNEKFKARLIGDYNNQEHYSGFQVARGVLPKTRADGSVATTRGFYDRARELGYTPLPIDPKARRIDLNTPYMVSMQTGGTSLQLDQKLADHTLTSITAWRFWDWDPSLDGDRTALAINVQSNLPTNQRQWSQELRVASPSGKRFEYTGGLYYFWQRTKEVPYNTYGSDAAKWLIGPTIPDEALDNVTRSGYQNQIMRSYSAFANATWHVFEKIFDLNAGLRYTYETRSGYYKSYPLENAAPLDSPVLAALTDAQRAQVVNRRNTFAPLANFRATTKGGQLSGTVNAVYHVTPEINLYAGYSRGFKSAGVNMGQPVELANGPAPKTFKPETVNAYEVGFKSRVLDRRLTTNIALFLSDLKGFQANQSILVDTSTGPVQRQYLTNAGDVRTMGVELDARAKPVDGLTFTGSLAYNDARFRNYPNGQCSYLKTTAENGGVCDLSGRQLTGVSKWVYNIAGEYEFDVSSLFGANVLAYFGASWNYRSSYFGTLNTDPYARVPRYGLASAFIGFRDPDAHWDLKFWGRNLFDKNYYVNASVDTQTTYSYAASLGDPRFFGGTLTLDL